MKTLLLPCALVALLCSCVTSGDIQRVADSVAEMERVLDDPLATQAELEAAIGATKAEVRAVADEVKERTEGTLSMAESGGLAGLVTAAGMAALAAYRNKTRERDLIKKA